jgi:hypothetical protein
VRSARWRRFGMGLLLGCACIIPDRDIRLEVDEPENGSAVRIIEPTPLAKEMSEICTRPNIKDEPKPDPTFCQQVRPSPVRSGLLRSPVGAFCICPSDMHDADAIPSFSIYAEDGDGDELYGVFLLDPDPFSDAPDAAVAYRRYWAAGREGSSVDTELPSVGREPVRHWEFRIRRDKRDRVDLCNDSGRGPLTPGLHHLQFMVTDRPFFTPQAFDDEGNPRFENGKPVYGNVQEGVPDLAAGATYDTVSYVFECQLPEEVGCTCEENDA